MKKQKTPAPPEIHLQDALIPEAEQPYKVPGNWIWTRVKYVLEVIMGQSPSGDETTDNESYTGLIGGAADMGEFYPNISRFTMKPTKLSQVGDVIVSIRATLGRPIFSDGEYCLGRGVAALRSKIVPNKLVRFFIVNSEEYMSTVASGTTFAQISKQDIEQMPFPLPPLAEQHRIVERIESLFEKLDRAKELAQNALDRFEIRKAAILHKAFTGELTAKWREENGVGLEGWEEKELREVVVGFKYGTSEKSYYSNSGVPVIRIPNISDGYIDFSDMKYLRTEIFDNYDQLLSGDILIIRSNGSRDLVGKCALVEKLDRVYTYASYLIRIRPKAINPRYLLSLFQSTFVKNQLFNKAKSSAGINNINSQELGQLRIPIPPFPEQQEIVRILDSLFEKEQRAKELADVVGKIDLMKKAILARAFRGELGTNEAGERAAWISGEN